MPTRPAAAARRCRSLHARAAWLLALALVGAIPVAALASADGDPDPALVEARRQKSNPSLNMLTYRHFDELFPSRAVRAGGTTRQLPQSNLTLADDTQLRIGGRDIRLADYLASARANAMLVLKDGRLVREIHRNGGNPESRYIAFSMSKSMISILFGIAIADRRIGSIDDQVVSYLPELRGSAYEGVRLRDLLTMRSGTSWAENYAPGSALDQHRDLSQNTQHAFYEDFARKVTRVARPGAKFNYSTLDTELLGTILTRATGRSVADFMSERMWKPAGMEASGYWVMQGPTGRQHEFYGAGFAARVRDYARVGQLMLDQGVVGRRQVVPRDWAVVSTSTREGDGQYFYQWWGIEGVDGFSARGVYGQNILVDRASRTVMVLLSYGAQADGHDSTDEFFREVVRKLGVRR